MALATFLRLSPGTNLGHVYAADGIVPLAYDDILYNNSITPLYVTN
jgi:hypothetical protein